MKQLRKYLNIKSKLSTIVATDETIHKIVREELKAYGPYADLNHIDVSKVTYMSELFSEGFDEEYRNTINPDITRWNMENVIDGWCMFYYCRGFNQDISEWHLDSVKRAANMFYKCASLTYVPKLTQLKLDYEIYFGMFADCKSLVTAPDLPATNLAIGCYMHMFNGCSKLENAPDLPATELKDRCYKYMFFDCPKIQEKNVNIAASTEDMDNLKYTEQMFGHSIK